MQYLNSFFWEEYGHCHVDLAKGLPMDNCVLMQFTGLLDKNGKEIYEFMEIDNKYRVIYVAPTYVLQDISNGDIVPMYEDQQITGEYSPVEKD